LKVERELARYDPESEERSRQMASTKTTGRLKSAAVESIIQQYGEIPEWNRVT